MEDQQIWRRSKKKALVLLMMLLDKEYKLFQRRYWTRQWVSRGEERVHVAYYTVFKELATEDASGFAEIIHENASS